MRITSWKLLKQSAFWLLVATLLLILLFPFYYAIVTSFKSGSSIFEVDVLPGGFPLDNYTSIFEEQSFARNIFNSLFVSVAVVGISLFLGLTAAMSLGRFKFRGRRMMLLAVLSVSMFPQVAVLSGMFELIRVLGLFNTGFGLIFSYLIFTLPFTVWVLTSFIREMPVEVEEAAIMDGAGPWTLLTKIFLPMMVPAMVTTGLLAFIVAWNEFLFALTFTLTNDQRTVPVAIALITGGSEFEVPWGRIMAASVIVTVPLIALVLIFQRRIVSGLTAGAVKG